MRKLAKLTRKIPSLKLEKDGIILINENEGIITTLTGESIPRNSVLLQIGYLGKEQYKDVIAKLNNSTYVGTANAHKRPFLFGEKSPNIKESMDYYINKFQDLGLLDIMFEPVFEEPKKLINPFKVGDKVRLIEGNESSFYGMTYIEEVELSNQILEIESIDDNLDFGEVFLRFKDKKYCHPYDCFELVSEKEILEDYVRKHYPAGTKVRSALNSTNIRVINGKFRINQCDDILGSIDNTGDEIYLRNDGKWAEILPSQPIITINGYTGKFDKDFI